jgi:hypothetical protein
MSNESGQAVGSVRAVPRETGCSASRAGTWPQDLVIKFTPTDSDVSVAAKPDASASNVAGSNMSEILADEVMYTSFTQSD